MGITEQFQAAMQAAGLEPPTHIQPDGALHRFSSNGETGDSAGWYVLHNDGVPSGAFGCWRTGINETWCEPVARLLTQDEEKAHLESVAEMCRQRDAAKVAAQAEAASRAQEIWRSASLAPTGHPYLVKKGVRPHGLRLLDVGRLVAPLWADGVLHSLQFIAADGTKRFLPAGRVAGCYSTLGKGEGAVTIIICEGYATGSSLYEATNLPVVIAFNAGNLKPVAETMRKKFPSARLLIAADDDYQTPGNPGMTAARDAAEAVGGVIAVPDFGVTRPEKATDFNDLGVYLGVEVVKSIIQNALSTQPRLLTCAADIESKPVSWLWRHWLAVGKLHILAGAPSTGKTTVALALAATVTTARAWPDSSLCNDGGQVIVWSGEDAPSDTLKPRLMAAGADLLKVHFVTGAFDPASDMKKLAEAIHALGNVKLLILDPIVSAVAGDSHKNTEVRRALQPVVDMAEAYGIAVVGITHLTKGSSGRDPLERVTGSLAFGAVARLVFVTAKLKDESTGEEYRAFTRAKSNIGPDGGGFRYEVKGTEVDTISTRIRTHKLR